MQSMPDTLLSAANPPGVRDGVVPPQWQLWMQSYQFTPKPDTRRVGFAHSGNWISTTLSFLLFTLGMLLMAVDRQQTSNMFKAFLIPRLFDQFLRQKSKSHGSAWSIARVLYFFILISFGLAIYRHRLHLTNEAFGFEWLYFLGISCSTALLFGLIHLLLGVAFAQKEWTLLHIQTTWFFFQLAIPLLLAGLLLTATLSAKFLPISLAVITVFLVVAWLHRLILGWMRAFHLKGVGLGYIIFYFCGFEILPLLMFLKYVTVHAI